MTDKPQSNDFPAWLGWLLGVMMLLVVITLLGLASHRKVRATDRRAAVAEIIKRGGEVYYRDTEHSGQELRVTKKEHYGKSISSLDFENAGIDDAGLEQLKEHLAALTKVWNLSLKGTQVTDAGLERVKVFTELMSLDLRGTQVTDAGLAHLKELPNLHWLKLDDTQITNAGLVHLSELQSLGVLSLGPNITDAGLAHLTDLKTLEWLVLIDTQATDEGRKNLQQALPNCHITETWE